MTGQEGREAIEPWLRPEHARAYAAALEWLLPRCRTEEERCLAPALLLLLAPLNALVVPCRPLANSPVNFQVTLSREGAAGPIRRRLTVRASEGGGAQTSGGASAGVQTSVCESRGTDTHDGEPTALPELWLDAALVRDDPLGSAARVLEALLWKTDASDEPASAGR
jgi:hypothetical protein